MSTPVGPRPPDDGRLSTSSTSASNQTQSGHPAKKFKLDPEKQALESQMQRQSTALVQSESRVRDLHNQLALADVRDRKNREEYRIQLEQLRAQLSSSQTKRTESQADADRLRSQLADCRGQLLTVSGQADSTRLRLTRQHNQQLQRTAQQCEQLTEELRECRGKLSACETQLLESEHQRELALLQSRPADQLQPIKPSTDGADNAISEHPLLESLQLELSSAKRRILELENEAVTATENVRLGELMKDRLANYQKLHDENTQMQQELVVLRGVIDKTMLLEEKLSVAEEQASRLIESREQVSKLHGQLESATTQLLSWQSTADNPQQLSNVLSNLRSQQLVLTDDLASVKYQLKETEADRTELQSQLDKLKTSLEESQKDHNIDRLQLKRLQRKLNLVVMERDSIKSVLTSYESETSVALTCIEQQKAEALEKCLSVCRQQVHVLEEQMQQLTAGASAARISAAVSQMSSATEADSERLQQLTADLEQQKLRTAELQEQLEMRALSGDYNPAETRVLTLKYNPAANATSRLTDQLERLKRENSTLLQRLAEQTKTLSSSSANVDGKQVADLKSRLRSAELRASRLKEVFGRSAQELRHSVYTLTGYKLSSDGQQLKLRSQYCSRPHWHLLFQRDADESVHLLETEMSSAFQSDMERYLYHSDSIPGFLASIQLKLLDQQLQDRRPSPEEQRHVAQDNEDVDGSDDDVIELD